MRVASDFWELGYPEAAPESSTFFEITAAVSEVADLARLFAKRKGLDFESTLPAGSQGRIEGVRGLIQDILRRVLDNAVQFTESDAFVCPTLARMQRQPC